MAEDRPLSEGFAVKLGKCGGSAERELERAFVEHNAPEVPHGPLVGLDNRVEMIEKESTELSAVGHWKPVEMRQKAVYVSLGEVAARLRDVIDNDAVDGMAGLVTAGWGNRRKQRMRHQLSPE